MELSNEFDVSVPIEQAWVVLTDLERIAPCLPGAQLQEVEGDDYRGIVKIKVGPIAAQYKGSAKFIEKDEAAHRAILSASGRDTRGQGNASASITAELTPRDGYTHVSVLTDLTITGKVAQFGRGVIGEISVKLLDQFVVNLESTVLAGESDASAVGEGEAEADVDVDVDVDSASAEVDTAAAAVDPVVSGHSEPEETVKLLASELAQVWQETAVSGDGPPDTVRAEWPAMRPRPDLLVPDLEPGGATGSAAPAVAADASGPVITGAGPRRIDSAEAEPIDLLDAAGTSMAKRLVPALLAALAVVLLIGVVRRRRARRR